MPTEYCILRCHFLSAISFRSLTASYAQVTRIPANRNCLMATKSAGNPQVSESTPLSQSLDDDAYDSLKDNLVGPTRPIEPQGEEGQYLVWQHKGTKHATDDMAGHGHWEHLLQEWSRAPPTSGSTLITSERSSLKFRRSL